MKFSGEMRQGLGWKNLSILAASLAIGGAWIVQSPNHDAESFAMPQGKTYVAECGGCHAAYAPGLLPARSWSRMLDNLEDHFGEDASLAEPARLSILKSLEDLAADGAFAKTRSRRIAAGMPLDGSLQRFTESAYFKALHDELPAAIWKTKEVATPSNCLACHPRANEGAFHERELRVPRIRD